LEKISGRNQLVTTIFVGNLDITVTEQRLREVFAAHGAVETVTIVRDSEADEPHGIAFVEMTHGTEAQAAIAALDGKVLNDRPMSVNEARPKLHRDPTRDSELRRSPATSDVNHDTHTAASFFGSKTLNGLSLTRDDLTSSYAIIRHNIRTYLSAGVLVVVKGRHHAESELEALEESQDSSDRDQGWRYFIEKTNLQAGTDPAEATQRRQAKLEQRESKALRQLRKPVFPWSVPKK
jgi:RNA recognition motif-containing protein